MTEYSSFAGIIDAFDSPTAMAEAMPYNRSLGRVYPDKIGMWKYRDSIPPEYWNGVVEAARVCNIKGITLKVLATIAERRKEAVNG
jgi:hypothetical protein